MKVELNFIEVEKALPQKGHGVIIVDEYGCSGEGYYFEGDWYFAEQDSAANKIVLWANFPNVELPKKKLSDFGVYHLTNSQMIMHYAFNTLPTFEEFKNNFKKVYEGDAHSLEEIYKSCQNDLEENEDYIKEGIRSIMVGDIIFFNMSYYRVEPIGFKEIVFK